MNRRRLLIVATVLLSAVAAIVWVLASAPRPVVADKQFPWPDEPNEIRDVLRRQLGKTIADVENELGLTLLENRWVDEPPAVLRGSSYALSNERSLILYIAEGEPLFREFNMNWQWDRSAYRACKVGGAQYVSDAGKRVSVGSAVPFQWRMGELDP